MTLYPKNLSGKANAPVVMNNSNKSLQPQYDGADFTVVTSVNTIRKQINELLVTETSSPWEAKVAKFFLD